MEDKLREKYEFRRDELKEWLSANPSDVFKGSVEERLLMCEDVLALLDKRDKLLDKVDSQHQELNDLVCHSTTINLQEKEILRLYNLVKTQSQELKACARKLESNNEEYRKLKEERDYWEQAYHTMADSIKE